MGQAAWKRMTREARTRLHVATCYYQDAYVELKDDGLIRCVLNNDPENDVYLPADRNTRQLALQIIAACDKVDRTQDWEGLDA
jgi:hypothetical protein